MAELTEDFLAPLVRHLRADSTLQEFNSLVPEGGTNPILGPPTMVLLNGEYTAYQGNNNLWIFRGFNQTGAPYANVEGTGSCAITLEHGSPWGRKIRGSVLSFVTVNVYYHCDVTRDDVIGAPVAYDARDKCISLHKQISEILHVKDKGTGGFLMWGEKDDGTGALKVVTSYAGRDLTVTPLVNGDGMVEGQATFELEILL